MSRRENTSRREKHIFALIHCEETFSFLYIEKEGEKAAFTFST
jgi:hypothetical protein